MDLLEKCNDWVTEACCSRNKLLKEPNWTASFSVEAKRFKWTDCFQDLYRQNICINMSHVARNPFGPHNKISQISWMNISLKISNFCLKERKEMSTLLKLSWPHDQALQISQTVWPVTIPPIPPFQDVTDQHGLISIKVKLNGVKIVVHSSLFSAELLAKVSTFTTL